MQEGLGLVVEGGGAAVVAEAVAVPHGGQKELPFNGVHVPDGHNRHAAEDVLPFDGL